MKKLIFIILFFILCLSSSIVTFAANDLTNQEILFEEDILKKDDINSVLTDELFTRGEMMVILTRLDGAENKIDSINQDSAFEDIKGHWAENYIIYAERHQWTNGYSVNQFKPDEALSKSEFSEFILRFLGKHTVGTNAWQNAIKDLEVLGIVIEEREFLTQDIFDLLKEVIPLISFKNEGTEVTSNEEDFELNPILMNHNIIKKDVFYNALIDETFTRAEMMVILSRLKKEEDKVNDFSLLSTFDDVQGHWAENYIAYAELQQWTNGYSMNEFKPDQKLTIVEFSEFILRFLGYHSIDSDEWQNALVDLEALGITIKEDEISTYKLYDLTSQVLPLISTTNEVSAVEEEQEVAVDIISGYALNSRVIQIEVSNEVLNVDKEGYQLKDNEERSILIDRITYAPWDTDHTKLLAHLESSLDLGEIYNLATKNSTIKISGPVEDQEKPLVIELESKAYNQIMISFTEAILIEALDVKIAESYGEKKPLEVLAYAYKDSSTILLTTEEQKSATLYDVNVSNVVDLADNEIGETYEVSMAGKGKSNDLQEITSVKAYDSKTIDVYFKEDVNTTEALNIENYHVQENYFDQNEIPVIKAEMIYEAEALVGNIVTLTLGEHSKNALYMLRVGHIGTADGASLDDAVDTATFVGIQEDIEAPESIENIVSLGSTTVEITLEDESAIESDISKELFEIEAKYSEEKTLEVLEVKSVENNKIVLSTEKQKSATLYALIIKPGIKDIWGNETTEAMTDNFAGSFNSNPITDFTVTNVDYNTYLIKFDENYGKNALDIENYIISHFGHPIKIEAVEKGEKYQETIITDEEKTIKMTMNGLAKGILYDLTISNVLNEDGIAMEEKELSDIFTLQYMLESED